MKRILKFRPIIIVVDFLLLPIMLISILWIRMLKFHGLNRVYGSKLILKRIGVHPIVNHYYEPFYIHNDISTLKRNVALKWNLPEQLSLLEKLNYSTETSHWNDPNSTKYSYSSQSFSFGDADVYYGIIRCLKSKKVIEIGSGHSTLVAIEASKRNADEGARTAITCVEPYEMDWLEDSGVKVLRSKVEDLPLSTFDVLEENDILFIDSSHMIKPGQDVLHEFFEILPCLKQGVLIHFHDIFTPFHYPSNWINYEHRLWNEQYLLEAFLSHNEDYEIVCALKFLHYFHFEDLRKINPTLSKISNPGSFWIRKL